MKCPYCGSENIEHGIRVGHQGDGQKVGLSYGNVILHTAQLCCDLCNDCGSVVRMYINENPKEIHNWFKK